MENIFKAKSWRTRLWPAVQPLTSSTTQDATARLRFLSEMVERRGPLTITDLYKLNAILARMMALTPEERYDSPEVIMRASLTFVTLEPEPGPGAIPRHGELSVKLANADSLESEADS